MIMIEQFQKAWGADTCYPKWKNKWSKKLPEYGQCAVTSLIVQDILGGEIAYNKKWNHYWNILPTGERVDYTRSQFSTKEDILIDKLVRREDFGEDVMKRYKILKERLDLN